MSRSMSRRMSRRMNFIQRGICSVVRRPVKSVLLLSVVVVISSFYMAGLASQSASIHTQDSTRQAVGATFRLELNEENRHTRLEEAAAQLGDAAEGSYGGVHFYQTQSGASGVSTDNSFETILQEDAEKIAETEGIEAYNLTTVATVVNPVNFNRIEDADADQSQDFGGVNLRGNRIMEMDMDVSAGKIKMTDGRMIAADDRDVCVISKELAGLNNLKIGDTLQFNQWDDKENSKVYSAEIVGIYESVQSMKPVMSGDSYRAENTIFTDLNFPEKPSGDEENPLFQYAVFKVKNVDQYDEIKKEIEKADINWERYDLIDNNGNIKSMAENFHDMEKISGILLTVVSAASFLILCLIFLFWMRNRVREIGILLSLGESKKKIWGQFLWEAVLIGAAGVLLSFAVSPGLSEAAASYLAWQTQSQAQEQSKADESMVSADGYTAPDLTLKDTQIQITAGMYAKDGAAVGILLFVSGSASGEIMMRKKPKEILSGMS